MKDEVHISVHNKQIYVLGKHLLINNYLNQTTIDIVLEIIEE